MRMRVQAGRIGTGGLLRAQAGWTGWGADTQW
jgi:hypothetical protein